MGSFSSYAPVPVSKAVFKALKPNGDAVHSDETAR
jgi:hypothetical protein